MFNPVQVLIRRVAYSSTHDD